MLTIHPIHAFNDNFIWSIEDSERQLAVVVDPGDGATVRNYLEKKGLALQALIITHHHSDHVGGIALLHAHYHCDVFGYIDAKYAGVTHAVADGQSFDLLGCRFEVMTVPGHTLDHIAFFSPTQDSHEQPWLFCGDTLFSAGCGRMFEGTPTQMHASLERLSELPPETLIYCAHEYTLANLEFALSVEPNNTALIEYRAACRKLRDANKDTIPTTIGMQHAINPFLRTDAPDVRAFAERALSESEIKALDGSLVFKCLREAKDHF